MYTEASTTDFDTVTNKDVCFSTRSGCSSSKGISSGLGIVNGWCVDIKRCSSSLHSNNGKSIIHKHSNLFLSLKPSLSPISNLKLQSWTRVLLALSPLKISNKSPLLAPTFSQALQYIGCIELVNAALYATILVKFNPY